MRIKWPWNFSNSAPFGLLLLAAVAHAASITGTVTNKTNGKPSAGDTVVLVDVQAGMTDAATATTDARGIIRSRSPGGGVFLIRVNHQGGTYFIAAPQGGGSGDVSVYDVATKVDGIAIDADMILAEAAGGMARVQERYLVRNTSLPPRAQFSANTFEFVLPPDAVLDGAAATRPGGMATNTRPVPLKQKGHFTINIPIQPNLGEKETLFELQYHISYNGKYTFTPQLQMPADNLVIYVPDGMTFSAAGGADFQPAQEDPRVQTFVAKNIHPGQSIKFTLSGEGQMPRDSRPAAGAPAAGMGDAASAGNRPGGGIGNPIGTPDPLSNFKGWIIGVMALLLVIAAAFMLRKQSVPVAESTSLSPEQEEPHRSRPFPVAAHSVAPMASHAAAPATNHSTLLDSLKDELFDLEREKINGTISLEDYSEAKAGLEAVLRRALKRG